jgi:hypothetical protein
MIQWLASVPLYVPFGMALLGFSLLAFYASIVRRLPYYPLGFQGAFFAIVSLLPVDGFTFIWASSVSLLAVIISGILLLLHAIRTRRGKLPAAT